MACPFCELDQELSPSRDSDAIPGILSAGWLTPDSTTRGGERFFILIFSSKEP